MKKTIITLLSVLAISSTSFAAFPDVDSNTHYQPEILWMQSNGIINGYGDGTFGPDNCVNRAEFLKMLYETMNVDLATSGSLFPDVPETAWFADYVRTGVKRGSVNGYPDGTFKPENCVNRAEAIKIAVIEYRGKDVGPSGMYAQPYDLALDDNYENQWYADYVTNILSSSSLGTEHFPKFEVDYNKDGVVDENEAFTNPRFNIELDQSMTRKEVAVMLYRLQSTKDSDTDSFYKAKADCRDGFTNYEAAFMPFSMCIPNTFIQVIEKETSVDPSCRVGNSVSIRDDYYNVFVVIESDDFALTCDHGGDPNPVDIDCFESYKSENQLEQCFSENTEVNEIRKLKNLDGKDLYYTDVEFYSGFSEKVEREKKYYLPLEDHNITIEVPEGRELEIQNLALTISQE